MQELDKKIHSLKYAIRFNINKSELPLPIIEDVLQALLGEVAVIQLTELRNGIIQRDEKERLPKEEQDSNKDSDSEKEV